MSPHDLELFLLKKCKIVSIFIKILCCKENIGMKISVKSADILHDQQKVSYVVLLKVTVPSRAKLSGLL